LTVRVEDQAGEPLESYAAPTVSVSSSGVDLGNVRVRPVLSGTYAAGVVPPRAGTWTIRVSLRL
jgi:copper transport protein